MGLTREQLKDLRSRRVQRATLESSYVNTINLADRVTLDFVWYPGARELDDSVINTTLPLSDPDDTPREVPYVWSRMGMPDVKRNLANGRVTLDLPPGSRGLLTVFDTQWQIVRPAAGRAMDASNIISGVQIRLNALGYHLRNRGQKTPFSSGSFNQKTERAVLSFQVDFQKPPSTPPGGILLTHLQVRGEWTLNEDLDVNLAVYNHVNYGDTYNPSVNDGTQLQAALNVVVGM